MFVLFLNFRLLRNGKPHNRNVNVASVIKKEPMDSPDELPAIEVQTEAGREDNIDENTDQRNESGNSTDINGTDSALPEQDSSDTFGMPLIITDISV